MDGEMFLICKQLVQCFFLVGQHFQAKGECKNRMLHSTHHYITSFQIHWCLLQSWYISVAKSLFQSQTIYIADDTSSPLLAANLFTVWYFYFQCMRMSTLSLSPILCNAIQIAAVFAVAKGCAWFGCLVAFTSCQVIGQ